MVYRLQKVKRFPNVHVLEHKFYLSAVTATQNGTIYPIIMQDEALGDPNSKYTNPESASFAQTNEPNCYPDSRVNYAKANIELSLNKATWVTDNIDVLKVMVFPIYTSFLENLTAINDTTSEEVEDILELQHETQDRQTYPLWNGTDLGGDFITLGANMPGLTTDTKIEGVDIDMEKIIDSLQFYTNGGKVRRSIGKIKTLFVQRDKILRLQYRLKSKAKRMNPYTFMGICIYVPDNNTINQPHHSTDITAGAINVAIKSRYNEWNENFNAMR